MTKEIIRMGFEKNIITIEDSSNGCVGICCKIGDIAFYFIGCFDESLTVDEYWESYTLDDTIDMIYETLKTKESAADNGIFESEYLYYESILGDING